MRFVRPLRPLLRRAFFPIAILAIAGFLTLRSRWEAPAQRDEVASLARAVLTGSGEVGATDPLILDLVRRDWREASALDDAVELDVREGDTGPVADGLATHTVMVTTAGGASLGLRVRYDRDPARRAVIGVWRR